MEVSYEDAHENSEVLVFAATASRAKTDDVAQGNIDTRPVILVLNRSASRIEMTRRYFRLVFLFLCFHRNLFLVLVYLSCNW